MFVAGILCKDVVYLKDSSGLLIVLLLFVLHLFWSLGRTDFRGVVAANYLLAFTIFLFGAWFAWQSVDNIGFINPEKDYYEGIVMEKPVEKNRSFQTVLQINNPEKGTTGKVIAYFSKEPKTTKLLSGSRILFLSRLNPIINKGNPYEFDYQGYMQKQGVLHSVYLKSNDYILSDSSEKGLFIWAEKSRNYLLSILQKHKVVGEEYTVVAALTMGYRKELNPETKDYFSTSGAMHVLAVSGLHVGIIYMIFTFLFSPVSRWKHGRILYSFLVAGFVWIYALLAGLSPSVQRAAVMFTFILIGQNLNRPANIFNSLAASAFLLILFNPMIIYETGFQLSYLAVCGIVMFQPLFYQLIEVKNRWLDKLWVLLSVSLAAQLATFPLGLYYFSQFPNYFWLSNFIVIPAATLILGSTFLLLLLSPLPWLADIFGFITQMLTHAMLVCLKWINSLPYAVTENISINELQTVILLLILATVYWFIKSKAIRELRFAFLLVAGFLLVSFFENYRLINQQKMIVYNSNNPVIQFIQGRRNYILTDTIGANHDQITRMVQPVNCRLKLDEPQYLVLDENIEFVNADFVVKNNMIGFAGKKIQLINKSDIVNPRVEYCISNDRIPDLSMLSDSCIKIIFTGGQRKTKKCKFNIYQTWTDGAFVADFKEN